jgi:hypothetical protein
MRFSPFVALVTSLVALAGAQWWLRQHPQPTTTAGLIREGDRPRVSLAVQRASRTTGAAPDVPLQQVFGEHCGVLIFYESACPVAKDISPAWRDVDSLHQGAVAIPVRWATVNPDDSLAETFLADRHLPGSPLFVKSKQDAAKLGVTRYPLVYLIGPHGRFLGELPRSPGEIHSLPPLCSERAS